jgi:hypothetical protein
VLQLRRKVSAEAVPAEPRLMMNLRQLLAPLPPLSNQVLETANDGFSGAGNTH